PTGVLWPGSPAQQDRVTGARAPAQHLAGRVKKPITAQQSINRPRQETNNNAAINKQPASRNQQQRNDQ
ncbi:MAG: hypothetical protein OZ927_18605, partial [Alcaligenaceae bacterium]|nr:hypothetical protein [Alcaligenaceae bacterium]